MQPQSSDHQFDFMLKNNQPAKSGRGLPKLPKFVKIILVVFLALLLIIVVSTVLSSRKNSGTKPIVTSVARGQEIIRVTTAVQLLGLQDPSIKATSTTVLTVLTSDRQQMLKYLATNKVKVSAAQIAADTDKTVDEQMQNALQSNGLDQAYVTYLQQNLAKYQNDLQAAFKTAPGPKGRDILKTAYDSETALLTNAPLKS